MKQYVLLGFLCLSSLISASAQEEKKKEETTLKQVVNTFKERISLSGYMQTSYTYDDADGGSNTFEVKRAILTVKAKITDRWDFCFMYNFANTSKILEAYTEYQFFPELSVRFGQFKTMFTIENPMSPSTLELINVNSQATNYLTGYDSSDPLYGSSAGRDIGLMIYGDLFHSFVSYNLAVMNGQGINKKDGNNQKDIVGRLIFNPWKWLSIGGSFIKGKGCAVATSDVNPDIQVGDNYTRNRWGLSALVKTQPLDIRTEYLNGKDGHVKSRGYYATFSYHALKKFDVIASYDMLNKNTTTNEKQTNYVAGVQYWFFSQCRLQAQYTFSDRKHGENSNMIQAQVQIKF